MKDKTKKNKMWRDSWMKVQILLICPKHTDIQRVVSLADYTEALEIKSRKKMWICKICGKRLLRSYGDVNFILPESFNTKNKGS